MSADKPKNKPANPSVKVAAAVIEPVEPPPIRLPPFFRKIDWLAFGIATLLVFIGYFLTLAPEVTMEDSGELATGSFYAGVPHPPGYPLWSIITYFFANFLPVGNVAYRVAVASAVAGSLAAGLLALLVSRGGSMMIESIPDFKDLSPKLENWICCVCGVTGGLLLAFNGYMWSQSVIVEVYPLSVLSLMSVCCLVLRWMYAPQQLRYLYWAWLLFGVCFTNHQTLIVAAMGLEVAVVAAHPRLGRDMLLWNSIIFVVGWFVLHDHLLGQFDPNDMVKNLFDIVGFSSLIGCVWLTIKTKGLGRESLPVLIMFGLWVVGAAIFFYMPITSMTNPPMNWGYPRTWDGFLHVLSRGQYSKTDPTNFFSNPGRLLMQLGMYCGWANDEFNLVNFSLAAIPILCFFRLQKRERSWLIGLAGIWFCLAIVLLILLNPADDRASRDLNKVFFASSYTVIAMYIGYGLALAAAALATQYQRFRLWAVVGGGVATLLALVSLFETTQEVGGSSSSGSLAKFFHEIKKSFAPHQYGLPVHAGLVLLGLAVLYLVIHAGSRNKPLMGVTLAIFALLPAHSIMSHWADNEQHNHWFGYWFGHDMFTPPFGIYPEMTRNAVLFGGTDPGRFCPTYMIFCDSFIPHNKQPAEDQKFDRRDVYIITQNALADPTYLEYIRAQYNRSTQIDPPFFQEMLKAMKIQDWLRSANEKDLNYTTNFFARLANKMIDQPLTNLTRALLDRPLAKFGARVEARRRAEGIYPLKEIYTPTADDSSTCFSDYMADAELRYQHDAQFPNEPKQIRPNEEVHLGGDNRISVSGEVAVMSINGLLTKIIFDRNPGNEFFVEESFPLEWMHPYLSPFGNIMKINRQPLAEVTPEMAARDHEFWSRYSERFVGNWITYDTSVAEIADFVEKVYLEHDYTGFKGDLKFIRDDVAQKSFSKLRSSIAGIYEWRYQHTNGSDKERMLKEADFAFRQAFALCPYSPDVVFRYVTLLLSTGRDADALTVASACLKLDPNNGSVQSLVKELADIKSHSAENGHPQNTGTITLTAPDLAPLRKKFGENSNDFPAAFVLVDAYLQAQQKDQALEVLDNVLNNPKANSSAIVSLARIYAQLDNYPKLEQTLEKLTRLEPHSPEAWCDLAALKVALDKQPEALRDLSRSLEENAARLTQNPKAADVRKLIAKDPRFATIRETPEYRKMIGAP